MGLKKRRLFLLLLIVVSLFLTSFSGCSVDTFNTPQPDPPKQASSDSGFNLKDIWGAILSIGKLEFLSVKGESDMVGFYRIAIFILIFALLNTVVALVLQGNKAGTVAAAVISIITAVSIPGEVLVAIAATYSLAVSLVLIGAPLVGAFFLVRKIPVGHWYGHALKIIILLIMVGLLFAMKSGISRLAGL